MDQGNVRDMVYVNMEACISDEALKRDEVYVRDESSMKHNVNNRDKKRFNDK